MKGMNSFLVKDLLSRLNLTRVIDIQIEMMNFILLLLKSGKL